MYDLKEERSIIVPSNESEANAAVENHIKYEHRLGLDCEWNALRPNFSVALIQIATRNHVILFQTCRFVKSRKSILPEKLANILGDKKVLKCGVNIEEDARRIQTQFGVHVRSWLDLRCLAVKDSFLKGEKSPIIHEFKEYELNLVNIENEVEVRMKRGSFMPKLGLKALFSYLFNNLSFEKAKKLQVFSNWETLTLSEEQKIYGAADAAASLDILYNISERDTKVGMNWRSVQESIFKYPSFHLPNPHEIDWVSLVEKPYNHKEIRSICIKNIASCLPEMWQVMRDYRGNKSRQIEVSQESTEIVGDIQPQDGMFWNFLKKCFRLIVQFVQMFALVAISILIISFLIEFYLLAVKHKSIK